MLEDLDNIYKKFDLYKIFDARLHDLDFNIKKKKIFDKFLITFTTIIALLQLFE